jgi:hypothetical protein
MLYPRLRYPNEHGSQDASDALVMCFYMQHSHKRIASAVMRALSIFRERIHPHSFDWYIDHDGYTYSLDDTRWENLRKEMLGSDESACPRMVGSPEGAGSVYVDYRGLPLPLPWPGREHDVSALFLRLPTEYLEEQGASRVRALAMDMAEDLPFNSGYMGLALSRPEAVRAAVELVRNRYPGLHLSKEGPDIHIGTQVDGVHWMNFLGQPVLGTLGGVSSLREHLSLPGVSIQELSGERAVITLGEQPDPGDLQEGRTLPLHRALARLLGPHLYSSKRPLGRMTLDEWRRWERRFLD